MIKEAVILDANESLSKALNYILKEGTAVVVVKKGKYFGIVDDRNIRLGIRNAKEAKLEKVAVRAPKIFEDEVKDIRIVMRRFLAGHFKALPVVDVYLKPLGMITRSDVLRELLSKGMIPKISVNAFMATPPYTIEEEETVGRAKKLMKELGVHRLIVVNKGRITGVISTLDFTLFMEKPTSRQSMQLITKVKRPDKLKVKQFLRYPPVLINQYEMLSYAAREMADNNVSYAIVVDDRKRPLGLISAVDIFKLVLRVEAKEPEVFINGLGIDDMYFYDRAKSILLSVVKKFVKSFDIDHLSVYVKKGKSVYTGNLSCDVEHIPLHIKEEAYDVEELFRKLASSLDRNLRKIKSKVSKKPKRKKARIELIEEEEYL